MEKLQALKSVWPIRKFRSMRIIIPMIRKAAMIWFADRGNVEAICREHYPKEMEEITAILNERPNLGGGSYGFFAPSHPAYHSLELQFTLDFGWHGFYVTWGWDRYNHFARIGLGVGSIRLVFWCPTYTVAPAQPAEGLRVDMEHGFFIPPYGAHGGDLDLPEAMERIQVPPPPPADLRNLPPPAARCLIGALCGKCHTQSPFAGTDVQLLEVELLKIGWAMEMLPTPVCPNCKSK